MCIKELFRKFFFFFLSVFFILFADIMYKLVEENELFLFSYFSDFY